jgi:hypothetical protein
MRQTEEGMRRIPWVGKAFQDIEAANGLQVNRLAAAAIGEVADDVSPAVRASAAGRLEGNFRAIGEALGPVSVKNLRDDLVRLVDAEGMKALPRREVGQLLNRFEAGAAARGVAGGDDGLVIPGSELIQMRSQVARNMRAAFSGSRADEGTAYAEVLDAVDEAIDAAAARSPMPDSLVSLYDQTRSQWSVLRALDRGGASPEGNVMAGATARQMLRSDKGGYGGSARAGEQSMRTGTGVQGEEPIGDFYDALRWRTSQMGRPPMGDSGTGTAMAVQNLLTGNGLLANVMRAGGQRMTSPLVRAYANSSPEAAAAMGATREAIARTGASNEGRAGLGGVLRGFGL